MHILEVQVKEIKVNAHLGSIDFEKVGKVQSRTKTEQLLQIKELNQFIRNTDNGNPYLLEQI